MREILFPSLKEGKNCKTFLASQLPPDMQYFSHSSQYATFSQSLVNADFFNFLDRPWYSDESVWRLHYTPYIGRLAFVHFLSWAKTKVFSLELYWNYLFHLLSWRNFVNNKKPLTDAGFNWVILSTTRTKTKVKTKFVESVNFGIHWNTFFRQKSSFPKNKLKNNFQ